MGSNPLRAKIFFQALFQLLRFSGVHNYEDRFYIRFFNCSAHIWFSYIYSYYSYEYIKYTYDLHVCAFVIHYLSFASIDILLQNWKEGYS